MNIPTSARVAVSNGKGGVGKSTLAQLLAVAWNAHLVDTDPQQTTHEWGQLRDDSRVHFAVDPSQAIALIQQLQGPVVVDTPGFLARGGHGLLATCSLIVIPTSARENDLRALGKTVGQMQRVGLSERCVIVPTRVHPRSNPAVLAELLAGLNLPICPHQLSERAVFDRAQIEGKVATEVDPGSPAAIETTAVARWVAGHVR